MGERETCAACGLPRATRDDLAALAPECRRHAGCSACDGVRLCWHDRADHCAETRGGWPAIVAAARAEIERLRAAVRDVHRATRERDDDCMVCGESPAHHPLCPIGRVVDDDCDGAHVGAAKGGERG